MADRRYRTATVSRALFWLFMHDHNLVGMALSRSRIIRMSRFPNGDLHVRLGVASLADRAVLTLATKSCTGTEMPGALDLAFEAALPDGEWPLFSFSVASEAVA